MKLFSLLLFAGLATAQLRVTTVSVPTATQYQAYSTTLGASGGVQPYHWSVLTSTGVSLPEGMSLDPVTGVVSATQVNGQGGYSVTVQVTDSAVSPSTARATIDFGVISDGTFGGCQMFPADSIYNQRIDMLPVDTTPSHQIPSNLLSQSLHPDFGHGFYPEPAGIPFIRVPADQPTTTVILSNDGQIDPAGSYLWPFPAWPNAVLEGTSYGVNGNDHHTLILQSSVNNINGPQTGPCTLYETYQDTAVASMFNAGTHSWLEMAGIHYVMNSNEIAASAGSLDNGAQDSPGIPIVPLLIAYSDVPMGVRHPLRITMPGPTNSWVWPGTGCCNGSGPPQGLLYRLKASVNWQAICPPATRPQAATLLLALQQYGAYMSDHGSAGYVQGVPDVRWNDDDLGCFKSLHVSDLEVVDNSMLEVSPLSGQSKPYLAPASLPTALQGGAYSVALKATGGTPSNLMWNVTSGSLPPGLTLNRTSGVIGGTLLDGTGSMFGFAVQVKDSVTGYTSAVQAYSITAVGPSSTATISSVTNCASGSGGSVAPGELVTIKGNALGPASGLLFGIDPATGMVPVTLAGTSVTFGTWSSPILYASATQINAIVPWEVAGESQVDVQVQSALGGVATFTVSVASAAPGIFTFDSTGTGPALAANQDGTYNGPVTPATPGSYVTVYFTGGGATNPPGVTGSVTGLILRNLTQLSSVKVTVGDVPANVTFAGAAPTLVDGVNQLNIQLSPATPTGTAVPLVISVGGQSSVATATISVR